VAIRRVTSHIIEVVTSAAAALVQRTSNDVGLNRRSNSAPTKRPIMAPPQKNESYPAVVSAGRDAISISVTATGYQHGLHALHT
jgi:hypothetical protein